MGNRTRQIDEPSFVLNAKIGSRQIWVALLDCFDGWEYSAKFEDAFIWHDKAAAQKLANQKPWGFEWKVIELSREEVRLAS